MSCIGERISALVDGELDHDDRERALIHLTSCAPCRAEAESLREVKRRMRALAEADPRGDPSVELLARLVRLAEPGEPLPPRRRPLRTARGRARSASSWPASSSASSSASPWSASSRRGSTGAPSGAARPPSRPARPARRIRFAAAGLLSLVVIMVGTAFAIGGSAPGGGVPRITPPVDLYAVEHSIISRELPMPEPRTGVEPSAPGSSARP